MCLAIPGEVIEITQDEPMMRIARVSFGGIVKAVNLSFTPQASVGDYVLAHVGFAINIIDPDEARRVFEYLDSIGELDEIKDVTNAVY